MEGNVRPRIGNKMDFIYNNSSIKMDKSFYDEGLEATERAINFCKTIKDPIDEKYNIFVYWIGENVNYKHATVIKSFLATQNLENATLRIYSDVKISDNIVFKEYTKFKQVKFKIFDVKKEIIGTPYEKHFNYMDYIEHHKIHPATESDFFRLLMLYKHGGFYIDFDVLLLRDLSPLLKYEFFYKWGSNKNDMINGAIMHLRKGSVINAICTSVLFKIPVVPVNGTLCWASDLYLNVKYLSADLVIFPAAFFDSEWQSNCHDKIGGLLEPLKKHDYSNMLYDGCFTWHWHNRWNEPIEKDSKFDILDKKIEEIFQKKFA